MPAYRETMPSLAADLLDARARRLLRTLIAHYLRDGQPVGSRTLAKASGLDVSPATIRNVMADLEEIGLVTAPHTSAGRVPTTLGYRFFVDSLLEVEPLSEEEMRRLRQTLEVAEGTQELLRNASGLLSAMTHFVGLVTVPRREQFAFRLIEFLPIGERRVLVVLVFTDHEVQNRIIETPRPFTPQELEQAANYLNTHCAGRPLAEIRARLVDELRRTRRAVDSLMSVAVELASRAFSDAGGDDVVVAGQTNLLDIGDLADLHKLRELFEAFQRKHDLLALLERCSAAQGVRVFIGEEAGLHPLDHCALITAPYHAGGQTLGVLGVIGPTRMAYERIIPLVEGTAAVVSDRLDQRV